MEYVPYVTQCRPENIKALLDAARMAELTTPAPGQTDTVVSTQLAEVRDEIREMNKKWTQLTVNPLKLQEEEQPQQLTSGAPAFMRGRGAAIYSPQQRGGRPRLPMQWQQRYPRAPNNQSWTPGAAGPQWSRMQPNQWPRQSWFGQQRPYNPNVGQRSMCRNCGRQSHEHPRLCPAINQYCRLCGKLNHFARCCMAAVRAMQTQGQMSASPTNYQQ